MAHPHRNLPPTLANLVDTGKGWLGHIRVRAMAWVLGIVLATAAVIMWTPVGWIPAVGVAAVAAVMTVSRLGHQLVKPVCYSCGHDLTGVADNEHGILCPTCGALHQGRRMSLGRTLDPRAQQPADAGDDDKNASG
jgi:predicted RNA-binding Zn-ribbon protein involved in translation (DUF1610 family)